MEEKGIRRERTSGTLASQDSWSSKKEVIGTRNWNRETHIPFYRKK